MSDPSTLPMPNCVIQVNFDEAKARFSYFCTNRSTGWRVEPDGSIYPPSPARVVQFNLKGYPDLSLFAGFQISLTPNDFPPEQTCWPPLPAGVTALSPEPYPSGSDTAAALTFQFDIHRFFYRLAVAVNGSSILHWDEPKIHDDGTE